MEILIKILQFIVSLSLLVIIHELGHFLCARLFKTRVEKFYLFFNPWFSLFKFKKGDTEYGMGWVPLGGYVKISGMIDESMDTDQMKQPAQPWEFRSKPAWQRLLIMTAGVIMNVVLAIAIYIGLSYTYGDRYIANKDVQYGYVFSDLAHEIGFQDGDKVISVGGEPIDNYRSLLPTIVFDKATYVIVERNGVQETIYVSEDYIPKLLHEKSFAEARIPFVVGSIMENSPAGIAGVQVGDKFVECGGEQMMYIDQWTRKFSELRNQMLQIAILRDSAGIEVKRYFDIKINDEGRVGVGLTSPTELLTISSRDYTFWQAIPAGFVKAGDQISGYFKQLKLIFSPKTEAYKSLGGFISIGNIFPSFWDWQAFWQTTAFLSIILAVMNILPIPALDGGHVLFLLYEVVTRRKPSEKFLERAQMVGLFILLALIIFANANDIYKLFF